MSNRSQGVRSPQLAYSELQAKTHDEGRRRRKAAKIIQVLTHFLGREHLEGIVALDIGSSTGFTADALRATGCHVIGVDIDLPGLAHARRRSDSGAYFICADGSMLPLADRSIDIVLFNQVYEHVVDADAVMSEIRRVLKVDGAAFLGFGNKHQVLEPHYRLPFLSWVPVSLADRYVSFFGRADSYYERFRTRRELLTMCEPLKVWDYTYTVLRDPHLFCATDVVPWAARWVPKLFWRSLQPIIPTYVWIGTPGARTPGGSATRVAPRRIDGERLARP